MNEKKLLNQTGIAYFAYIAIAIVVQYLLAFIFHRFFPQAAGKMIWQWLLSLIPMYAIAFPICIQLLKRVPKKKLFQKNMKFGQLVLFFMMCLCVMFIGNLIGTIVNLIIGSTTNLNVTQQLQEMMLNSNLVLVLFLSVVLAPIIEELLFRKLLIDRIIVFGDKAAILISGFFFGLLHGNFSQFFYAAGLGCMFAYVYIRTGKIKYTIGLHMAINFFCSGMYLILFKVTGLSGMLDSSNYEQDISAVLANLGGLLIFGLYLIAIIGMGIAGFVLLICRRKQVILKQGEQQHSGKEMAKLFFSTPGVWLYLAACVFLFVTALWPA